jgi:raffinose/stachyose/melibiose transport system permease protein
MSTSLRASKKSPVRKPAVFVCLCLIAATTVYPLYFMVANAFKSRIEYYTNVYGPPHQLDLGNFGLLVENFNILGAIANSLEVVVTAAIVSTLLAALASFPLAKLRFRGSRPVFALILAFMLVPGQVLLVPIYLFFSGVGLINNPLSVGLIYVATSLPFGTFLLTSGFRGIPSEVIEAARIDGASMARTFVSIVLPMGTSAFVTLAVLNFLNMWNELLLALLLMPDEARRLLTPTLTTMMGRYLTDQPLLMSGLLISSLPTILVLIVASRYLIRGISVGVGK